MAKTFSNTTIDNISIFGSGSLPSISWNKQRTNTHGENMFNVMHTDSLKRFKQNLTVMNRDVKSRNVMS